MDKIENKNNNNFVFDFQNDLWIRKVGGLMKALDQSRQFADYLAELRVRFKPKRNFIKLLDEVVRSTAQVK